MLRPPTNDNDQKLGNENANLVLVEFGDYQCPHCGHAYPLLKQLTNKFANDMQFVFRNFPLAEIHPFAFDAALAAEAAGKQGKFWEMHDMIFEHQDKLSSKMFLIFAKDISLNEMKFAEDWKSNTILSKVEDDFESGVRSGVNGTPTLFLNGKRLNTYDGSYQSLEDAIVTMIRK